jgi:hypothetical protein
MHMKDALQPRSKETPPAATSGANRISGGECK